MVVSGRGKVSAVAYLGRETLVLLEFKVHHPSDSIGAILSRSTIAQHLYFGEGKGGNGVQVSPYGTTSRSTIYIDKGRGVAALSVEQYERLVRA